MITRRERFWMVVSVALAIVLLIGGRTLPSVNAGINDSDLFKQLKLFTDVMSVVQRDYFKEVSSEELVSGAIKGMLTTLDPHSSYLDPSFYNDLQVETSGEFGGLGIEITLKDNLLVVVAPIEDSPAEKAGIHAGDAIIKIDGKFTKDLSLTDAVKKMRGAKGSPITLSIFRKGSADLIDVVVVRDIVKVKSIRSKYLNDNYGYIRITQFQDRTAEDMQAALEKLKRQAEGGKLAGLVLDLRNNPGGLLTQAIRVADTFLNEGVIVYTDGRVESQKKKFFAHARGTEPAYPIIVLVNGGSASASEIVSGALKDHGRALILGTKTFGKGSVQTILPLENGGALRLTTALYYTKSGRSLQAYGVEPDVIMELPRQPVRSSAEGEDEAIGVEERIRESDLPGAITNPSGREEKKPAVDKKPVVKKSEEPIESLETIDLQKLLSKDAQLQRALELLKTFNIFKGDGPSVMPKVIQQAGLDKN